MKLSELNSNHLHKRSTDILPPVQFIETPLLSCLGQTSYIETSTKILLAPSLFLLTSIAITWLKSLFCPVYMLFCSQVIDLFILPCPFYKIIFKMATSKLVGFHNKAFYLSVPLLSLFSSYFI